MCLDQIYDIQSVYTCIAMHKVSYLEIPSLAVHALGSAMAMSIFDMYVVTH